MVENYYKLKRYYKNNNPLLLFFLTIYPALLATFDTVIAIYDTIVITILIIFTKMTLILCNKFFTKRTAHSMFVLYVATYCSIVYLILIALYPYQIKLLIVTVPLLVSYTLLNDYLNTSDEMNTKLSHCFIDGFLYFIISICLVLIVSMIEYINYFNHDILFSLLNFALATFILKSIIHTLEGFFEKKYGKKE